MNIPIPESITPNRLTAARIALIPLMVIIFYIPFTGNRVIVALIFALAAVTDWLDGYLARKLGKVSNLGAFLDPVADKLIVAIALVLLVEEHSSALITIAAAIIIGREIIISALREWMAELGKRTSVAVSVIGKIKTFAQMGAITLLLAYKPGKWEFLNVFGTLALYVAAVLTLWSMYMYLKVAWPDLTLEQKR